MVFMTTFTKCVEEESGTKNVCNGTIWVAELFSLTLLRGYPDSMILQ